MKIILFWAFIACGIFPSTIPPNYRAMYRLVSHPDSTNLNRIVEEHFLLFIKENQSSYFASENFLKRDSIDRLVKEGKLSVGELISEPKYRFKTRFSKFIIKDYLQKTVTTHEVIISVFPWKYTEQSDLAWTISAEQDTLSGYPCTKAITHYAGRQYEAWFTADIPISDGPYIFGGLPGLIVKLNDTKNHYVFTLEQFGKYSGKITEMLAYRKQQPVVLTHQKAFEKREEVRKDQTTAISNMTGISFDNQKVKRSGSSEYVPYRESLPDRSWDNNPLELKLK
ncbi:MAG: GLPGLI family protein [Spirosomataceae bacterium]